jgi:hypothetical protein
MKICLGTPATRLRTLYRFIAAMAALIVLIAIGPEIWS